MLLFLPVSQCIPVVREFLESFIANTICDISVYNALMKYIYVLVF